MKKKKFPDSQLTTFLYYIQVQTHIQTHTEWLRNGILQNMLSAAALSKLVIIFKCVSQMQSIVIDGHDRK